MILHTFKMLSKLLWKEIFKRQQTIFFHSSICFYNLASQQNYALPYFELRIKIETAWWQLVRMHNEWKCRYKNHIDSKFE